jgi:plastocyanin
MQNSMAWLWGIIIAIIVLGGGYYFLTISQDQSGGAEDSNVSNQMPVPGSDVDEMVIGGEVDGGVGGEIDAAPIHASVTYNGTSFSPQSVTVRKGGTVTWTSTAGNMWVASARHPDHTVYAGTTRQQHCPDTAGVAFDQCATGTTYSFKFDKTGTWNYHDHINASAFGSVVVVE